MPLLPSPNCGAMRSAFVWRDMRLIVTEKNNSAKKIADILSGGPAKADAAYKVPFYTWTDGDGEQMTIGLKGHVMSPAFPDGYSNWQETDLHELIDAELTKEPTDKNVVKAVRKVAKEAGPIVIATDYDREGELIGLEALEQVVDVNPKVAGDQRRSAARPPGRPAAHQARPLLGAHQGGDRARLRRARRPLLRPRLRRRRAPGHRPDLGRHADPGGFAGDPPLRLQLPLGRPRAEPHAGADRRARAGAARPRAKPYWELFARFEHPDESFEAHHATDKFWESTEAEAALAGTKSPGVVKEVTSKRNSRRPPDPLQHHGVHHRRLEPARDHAVAGDADRRGPLHGRLHLLSADRQHGLSALAEHPRAGRRRWSGSRTSTPRRRCSTASLKPTRGKKETTDHPPIYPTQAVYPGALEGPKRRVYELVVRRFLATFAQPMITESTRADIEAGSETYFVRGSVVVDPGYAAIYTYARSGDEEIPKLTEGQELALDGEPWMVDKETQPPSRISQGKLVELMEERGLGTKATRADIIQKLYDRGYVYGNPPEPSETGIAMYKAFHEYVPRMATPEMTAELEQDMDQIAAGRPPRTRSWGSAARCSTRPPPTSRTSARTSPSRSGPGWTRTSSSARARSARRGEATRTAPRTACGSSS